MHAQIYIYIYIHNYQLSVNQLYHIIFKYIIYIYIDWHGLGYRSQEQTCILQQKHKNTHKTKTKLHHIFGRTGEDCKPYLPHWGKLYLFKIKV